MRFDPHKAKNSRRWQARRGGGGGGGDTGGGGSRRRGVAEHKDPAAAEEYDDDDIDDQPQQQSEEDQQQQQEEEDSDDAQRELRELKELISDAEQQDFDPNLYFKFKDEKAWGLQPDSKAPGGNEDDDDELYQDLFSIDIAELEASLKTLPLHVLLDTEESFVAPYLEDGRVIAHVMPAKTTAGSASKTVAGSASKTGVGLEDSEEPPDHDDLDLDALIPVPSPTVLKMQQQQLSKQDKKTPKPSASQPKAKKPPLMSAGDDELDSLLNSSMTVALKPNAKKPPLMSGGDDELDSLLSSSPIKKSVGQSMMQNPKLGLKAASSKAGPPEQDDLDFFDEVLGK